MDARKPKPKIAESLLLMSALCLASCGSQPAPRNSVTVKLPPARPHVAQPGFSSALIKGA